jgi:hypothetical protein
MSAFGRPTAFSTRRTQEAQVIPVTPRVTVAILGPAKGVLTLHTLVEY